MASQTSLSNHFLIAMPALENPYFDHTVSYICEHNEEGAMAFVINRPIGITIGELFEQTEIDASHSFCESDKPVYFGGPVEQDRGFVLHSGEACWSASIAVTDDISVTTSLDILEAIGKNEGPENFLLLLGYAGWGPRQLEDEMLENSWLSAPADQDIIFKPDCTKSWQLAAESIGINIQQLSTQAGHA